MSKTSTMCHSTVLLVALLLGAVPLLAVPNVALPTHPPERWAGYEIPTNGQADGGWIGGYRIGGRSVFVVTPTRQPNRRGYQRARIVDDLGGRHGATRRETERAAWILSKYGGYRDATQAAAVDASVYDLVAGGRWRTTGTWGARRIDESPQAATVRRFARIMLGQSRRRAGEYHARVAATNSDVGGAVEATVTVTDGHGRPAAGLPVSVETTGAAAVEAVTGDDGRAVARFAVTQPGWHGVTATVRGVPEHRIHLRLPVRPEQAAAAEGGVRRTLVARGRAAVRGAQTVALRGSPATILAGAPARVTATVTGDGTPRSASATLYGPFGSVSAAQCAGPAIGTGGATVSGDGDYTLPASTPGASGYYAWQVTVDGTPTALPIAACGAVTTVKAVAAVSVNALNAEMPPGTAEVRVGLSGLPRYPAVDVTLDVRGPYATRDALWASGCSGAIAVSEPRKMNGDATFVFGPYVEQSGWYSLQATVPPGELRQGAQSACPALGAELHVF